MTDDPTPEAESPAEDASVFNADTPHAVADRPISEAARRALREAADRRAAESAPAPAVERGGPRGPEPTRYGDWEKKGLAVDF